MLHRPRHHWALCAGGHSGWVGIVRVGPLQLQQRCDATLTETSGHATVRARVCVPQINSTHCLG